MIHIKEHKQKDLFDPWAFLGPKRRELLDQSWAGLFQKELLYELPVGEMIPFFTHGFGRPTKELYTVLGALVLQQAHDLTDEETVNQVAFNTPWHDALNITEESDSATYFCPKSLWNMRSIVVDNGLDAFIFDHSTDKLAKVFKVKTDNQRVDSVHIKFNMRRLGRIGIVTPSINKFLVNLKRGHQEHVDTVDTGITERYLSEKSLTCFSMAKPSESAKTLASVSTDLFDLLQQFKDHPDITAMHSYKLCERVLKEQCTVSDDGITLSDFEMNEKGDVASCPQGHVPVMTKKKKTRHTVAFDSQNYCTCPVQETCPVQKGKRYHYFRYTEKEMPLAQRRAYEHTDTFKDRYRWRAGIEATMSEYDRRTGVKHLRVRGFKAVRFSAALKAVGVNIFRATAVRKALNTAKAAHQRGLSGHIHAIFVVKEHVLMAWGQLQKIFILFDRSYGRMPIMAG